MLTSLCVDLINICDSLCEQIGSNGVTKLVFELCCFRSGFLYLGSGVGDTTCHDTSDLLCQFEDVRDCRWLEEFVLRSRRRKRCKQEMGCPTYHHCQLTGIFLCVQTTAQSFPLTATLVNPSEVMALKAYSTWYNLPSGEKTVHGDAALAREANVGGKLFRLTSEISVVRAA